ncbi:Os03g0416250 [Oryza sativa Japonica Group]|uniref:Os03g0416250 protein n=1 Tax=Oryza sativa subsp. japonica TaxID=39947 RepID=A0A0P0VZJ0_ORYSJ|nr:hypothetical protein EE612_018122 [Oryza sativa]BAS84703.1 Os03g0416250 [Oryza sativa Japonica Group]
MAVEGLVLEAEDLGDVVEVGVLGDERPLGVVHAVVEVCDGDLGAPVVLVVELDVPVHADRAHVRRALQQRRPVLARRVHPRRQRPLRVAHDALGAAAPSWPHPQAHLAHGTMVLL